MFRLLIVLAFSWPLAAAAQQDLAIVHKAVEEHVLPGHRTLAKEAAALDAVAARDCAPQSATLRKAYNATFDAWMGVSHLRFGPSESENRAFALAFWPDSRGATPKTLAELIATEDPIVDDPEAFSGVSIAARGLFALELMLYDESLSATSPDYACRLTRAIAHDIARTTEAIQAAWNPAYADILMKPGPDNPVYFSEREALQELYKALMTGLEFTADQRIGRPLGTFERPRPTRAEAWRSGRSLRNVTLSIEATGALAQILASTLGEAERTTLNTAIAEALEEADGLEGPIIESVTDPAGHLRVEVLQQSVRTLRTASQSTIGVALGVSQGFNSLDGD
jgi:uncharacterized protein